MAFTKEEVRTAVAKTIPAMNMVQRLNDLACKHTASDCFVNFIFDSLPGNYRPTIRTSTTSRKTVDIVDATEKVYLADAYDAVMQALGDERRAYRG